MKTLDEKNALLLKKLTLTAWAKHFLKKGVINIQECNKMISLINEMK